MGPSPISHLAAGDSSEDDEEVSDSWVPPPPKKWSLKQHPKGFVIFDDFLGGNVALGGLPDFHDKKRCTTSQGVAGNDIQTLSSPSAGSRKTLATHLTHFLFHKLLKRHWELYPQCIQVPRMCCVGNFPSFPGEPLCATAAAPKRSRAQWFGV